MTNFTVNGFTDERTICDRCGKTGLKGTYNIDTDDGNNYFLGSSCIKKAYQMTQKEFTTKVKDDERERMSRARNEFYASREGSFYTKYIGSTEHDKDINEHGFSYVLNKIKPADTLRKSLEQKYNLSYLSV